MTELNSNLSLAQARSLIDSYAFDLGRDDAEQLLEYWLKSYQASWIRLATIEALYLGRYKAISVEQILNVWLRIGSPNPHFTYEFERLICRKLPKHLSELTDLSINEIEKPTVNLHENRQQTTLVTTSVEETTGNNLDTSDLRASHREEYDLKDSNTSLVSAWRQSHQANWSELVTDNKSIHQFIPLPDVSSFFNRLKTFAEER